jgi:hypothetical protein
MEGNMRGPSSADCEKSQVRAMATASGAGDAQTGHEGVLA